MTKPGEHKKLKAEEKAIADLPSESDTVLRWHSEPSTINKPGSEELTKIKNSASEQDDDSSTVSSFIDLGEIEGDDGNQWEFGKVWYAGKVIEGSYSIEGVLGQGGMGIVYKATDLVTNKLIVIKSLLPQVAQDKFYRQRFLREAEEWVSLGMHPNIVRAFTVHEIEWLPRIVAEYVDGKPLKDHIEQGLSTEQALKMAVGICWGMAFAHDKELAHRDLKPDNILVTNDGTIKITDFGLVKRYNKDGSKTATYDDLDALLPVFDGNEAEGFHDGEDASLIFAKRQEPLRTMGSIGTPDYIAPEQWRGDGSITSDIYSFGVILFEMFCGQKPFSFPKLRGNARLKALQKAHCQTNCQDPRELNKGIPETIATLITQCLQKTTDKRPKDFRTIAAIINTVAAEITGQIAGTEPPIKELDRDGKLDQANGYLRLAGGCLFRGDNDQAMDLLEKAHAIFVAEQDQAGIGKYYNSAGIVALKRGYYDQALEIFSKSLEIAEARDDHASMSKCYNNLGNLFCYMKDNKKALEVYNKSLQISTAIDDHAAVCRCYINIGTVFKTQDNYEQALEMCRKSLAIAKPNNDHSVISCCYNNIGNILMIQSDYEQALEMYRKSLKIAETLGDRDSICLCHMNIAIAFRTQDNYELSLKTFNKGLKLAKALDDHRIISACYIGMGDIFQAQGKDEQALKIYHESLSIMNKLQLAETEKVKEKIHELETKLK